MKTILHYRITTLKEEMKVLENERLTLSNDIKYRQEKIHVINTTH